MQQPRVFTRQDLTYNTYLKVPELLDLQVCQADPPHHDEMLFIVIHQAYELWFKLILGEIEVAMQYMAEGKILRAHHFMRRVTEIQKLLVSQIHILETMTPIEFLGFRDYLNPASGFQSLQFRELEFVAGLKDPSYYEHFEDQAVLDALKARAEAPSLWDAFVALIGRSGFSVPATPIDAAGEAAEPLLVALTEIYARPEAHMELYMLAEDLVDFDTQLGLWRFHHVSVVERIIGAKPGTGGSAGAAYLRSTLTKRCYGLLLEARTRLAGDRPGYGAAPAAGCPFHRPGGDPA